MKHVWIVNEYNPRKMFQHPAFVAAFSNEQNAAKACEILRRNLRRLDPTNENDFTFVRCDIDRMPTDFGG